MDKPEEQTTENAMQSNRENVVQTAKNDMAESANDIASWQIANALEQGRNEVLRMVARQENLEDILDTLCRKAQIYSPEMLCSVLRLDNEKNTLHPIASISLPDFYCAALEGVEIGAGVGSCGTAAATKKRVVVEDINTHPYWHLYKGLALKAGVEACWSEPIIGADGMIYGTFAMYYRKPRKPTEEDLRFIELSANLAAVVFENQHNRQKLIDANLQLSQTVDERTAALEQANLALEQALQQQSETFSEDISAEKMQTTNNLLTGFSHEISTPLGTALTAIGAAEDKLTLLDDLFTTGKLTRKTFVEKVQELESIIELNKTSLRRATELLTRFKSVNAATNMDLITEINLREFFEELRLSLGSLLGEHQLNFDGDDISFSCARGTLWQVFYNLVENSVDHGFNDSAVHHEKGLIQVNFCMLDDDIVFSYQDDGKGIDDEHGDKVFEPFYSSKRSHKNIGLGLNVVSNLINHTLQGRIRLIDSPVGVRYEIRLPKQREQQD